LKENYL